jgi:hypothetical protein
VFASSKKQRINFLNCPDFRPYELILVFSYPPLSKAAAEQQQPHFCIKMSSFYPHLMQLSTRFVLFLHILTAFLQQFYTLLFSHIPYFSRKFALFLRDYSHLYAILPAIILYVAADFSPHSPEMAPHLPLHPTICDVSSCPESSCEVKPCNKKQNVVYYL